MVDNSEPVTMRGPVPDRPLSTVNALPTVQPSVVRPAIVYFLLFGAVGAYFPYISVFFQSIGLRPTACTRTLTWLAAGDGSGSSSMRRTSGEP